MALTPSRMVELGTKAPDFALSNTEGKLVSLKDFQGRPLLVVFMCNHCPYVKHIRKGLAELTSEFLEKGLATVGINSNDADSYPEDSPEKMVIEKKKAGYRFDYLYDETQAVAKAYQAACTPDFFLFDSKHRLVYRGQMDESRPGNGKPVTGKDLREAMELVLEGKPISLTQKASVGCNIKWK